MCPWCSAVLQWKKCENLVQRVCNTNSYHASINASNQDTWECTVNADCIATGVHSICECKMGFVPSDTGR